MVIIKNRHRYISPQVSFEEEESVAGLLAGSVHIDAPDSGETAGDDQGKHRGFAKESVFDDYEYKLEDFEYTIPE